MPMSDSLYYSNSKINMSSWVGGITHSMMGRMALWTTAIPVVK